MFKRRTVIHRPSRCASNVLAPGYWSQTRGPLSEMNVRQAGCALLRLARDVIQAGEIIGMKKTMRSDRTVLKWREAITVLTG